jgi:hypothetical protein
MMTPKDHQSQDLEERREHHEKVCGAQVFRAFLTQNL